MTDSPRLIEKAFPLKQASLDSVHEKNVRHGHISTLHIWPARRPLAACRAALIATLLPDPGSPEERKKLVEKIGGRVVQVIKKKKLPSGKVEEKIAEETVGGILHWGRESDPAIEWFRQEIKKAYGGRAPKVLDPFAGGGSIPLEAMRLGCEATAIDLNPVAWFILKCTLEYPQKLAGQHRPLPRFALESREFMASFFKETEQLTKKQMERNLDAVQHRLFPAPDVDLAWHVRAWGWWVLQQARKDLARFYPTYAGFERPDGKPVKPSEGSPAPAVGGPHLAYVVIGPDDSVAIGHTDDLEGRLAELRERFVVPPLGVRPLGRTGLGSEAPTAGGVRAKARTPNEEVRAKARTTNKVVYWEGHATRDEARKRAKWFQSPEGLLWIDKQAKAGRLTPPIPTGPHLVPLKDDGTLDLDKLNAGFGEEYLNDPRNPRWVPKPTVAYLWARTVSCKNCRATIPLLKTRWLAKTDTKRVLLTMQPNVDKTGVVYGIHAGVPKEGSNTAQRREHDKRIGAATMSRSGATCPCCRTIMTMEDIRLEGRAGRLAFATTAVAVDGTNGKEYRLPTDDEARLAAISREKLDDVFALIPFAMPEEPLASKEALGFRVPLYGIDKWSKLFAPRQLLTLATFIRFTRSIVTEMHQNGYPPDWVEAVSQYLALSLDRLVSFNCVNVRWKLDAEAVVDAFARFALPMLWDFAEAVPPAGYAGGYSLCYERIALALSELLKIGAPCTPTVVKGSATETCAEGTFDAVVTDPPYYDAIPYSDLMDFFYVWLRRTLHTLSPEIDDAFQERCAPKWDHEKNDGELIDDDSRFGGDKEKSRAVYEEGMYRCFVACRRALKADGRLVIVFAHKHPDAWETLVSAMIRAGFVVDGSWPIQTEMANRTRALTSAALSSSVWLVCKKRSEEARPGWDAKVLEEMRERITAQLREFWDAGIRGPDFVWSATGPALEAYSKHPVVKKANEPGKLMGVSEFLRHVRRIVVDFVVGRVLSPDGGAEAVSGLDDVTTYYLLHRHDFGVKDTPIGPCILYAVSCGLSDGALADQFDILVRTGGQRAPEEDEEEEAAADETAEVVEGTGSTVRLRAWNQRVRPSMGYDPAVDSARARRDAAQPMLFEATPEYAPKPALRIREIPLIDQVHRLMHLWKAGDVVRVDDYLDLRALRRNALFHQLLQALIELAPAASEERSLLESISNHVAARGVARKKEEQKELIAAEDAETAEEDTEEEQGE